MSKSIVYNISYKAYLSLISNIESKFNLYKELLFNNNIILQHPSLVNNLSSSDRFKISQLFPKETKTFGTAYNFYNCLLLVNYHLGSLIQVTTITPLINEIQTISINIEDILIIESFKDL